MISGKNVKFFVICNIALCTKGNLYHSTKGFYRIFSCCSLTGKHDRACSLINSICHVCCLRTGRSWIFHHGIQHLSCCDYLFACIIDLVNDLFLDNRNIFQRNLHTHISTGDHDSVCHFHNAVDIINALLIFNLGNNINVTAAVFIQNLTDLQHILCCSGKRSCNKVKALFDSKKDILSVFFADKRHVYIYSGKIHALFIGNHSSVYYHTVDFCSLDLFNLQADQTIVDQNTVAGLHILIKIFVGNRYLFFCSLDVLCSQNKLLAFCYSNLAFFKFLNPDFRSLCIEQRSNGSVDLCSDRL